MSDDQKVEKEEYTPQQFASAYGALCSTMGFRIVAIPTFIPTNHGTFEFTLKYSVEKNK